MPKVLLNDGKKNEPGLKIFEDADFETELGYKEPEELMDVAGNYDAITVRSKTKITKDILESGVRGRLRVVGRAGVGVDNIDVEAANNLGVPVYFAPHGNTNSTAELALASMFALARSIPQAHWCLRNNCWNKKQFTGIELAGKTLGVIGCGRIGQALGEKARAIGMNVIGFDENSDFVKSNFQDSRIEYVGKEDLLKVSDFVSIHTGGKAVIVGRDELGLMKPTAYLVNASRAGNVDNGALYDFLSQRKIAGVALDAHEKEPKKDGEVFESRFSRLENVVLIPHLGASTREAEAKTSVEMAQTIIDAINLGSDYNCVNKIAKEDNGRKTYPLEIVHDDTEGVFGAIGSILGKYHVSIKTNPSIPMKGRLARTTFLVYSVPSQDAVDEIRKLDSIRRVQY